MFLFDDSFEHEAWNDSASASRINLIIDVWHPDLSPAEIEMLEFLQRATLSQAKSMSARFKEQQKHQQKEGEEDEEAGKEEEGAPAVAKAAKTDVDDHLSADFYGIIEAMRAAPVPSEDVLWASSENGEATFR